MRRTWKNFLSLLLVFAMVLSLGVSGFALDDETDTAEETAPAEETSGEVSALSEDGNQASSPAAEPSPNVDPETGLELDENELPIVTP